MQEVIDALVVAQGFLDTNAGTVGLGLTGILFVVAKIASSEAATGAVKAIQAVFDTIAGVFLLVGNLFQKGSKILADAVRSDGILGKK